MEFICTCCLNEETTNCKMCLVTHDHISLSYCGKMGFKILAAETIFIQHNLKFDLFSPFSHICTCSTYSFICSFLLVFESHLCQHYQSDFLWQALSKTNSVVPVVFGGKDMARILPEGAEEVVIDALSQEPQTLAHYLR